MRSAECFEVAEAMLGHHLSYEASLEPSLTFRNHRRRVALDMAS